MPTTLTTPDLKCAVDGCKDPVLVKKRRLCRKHYTRWQRYGTPHGLSQGHRPPMRMSPEERFEWYTIQEDDHWMWTGPTIDREVCTYGRIYMGPQARPRTVLAHRYAYEFFIGLIPDELEADHTCETTLCVNPWHLELVPHVINVRRGTRWAEAAGIRTPAERRERETPREDCPRCGDPYVVYESGERRCQRCYNAQSRDWTRRTGRVTGEGTGARGREKTHCPRGHEYTPENTYRSPKKGLRDCLTCRRERSRQSHERERQNRPPAEKAEKKAYCVNGHEYTPENTRIQSNGKRSCRTCASKRRKQTMERKRVERLDASGESKRKLCPLDCTCGRHTRSGPRRRKQAA